MRYKGIKGKAWEACRKYICERDGWKCVTCGRSKVDGWVMNAGHYQPVGKVGSNNTLSWDENNIFCQCAYCNGMGQGEQEKMGQHIKRVLGEKKRQELLSRVNKLDPVKNWQGVIDYYKQKLNELCD